MIDFRNAIEKAQNGDALSYGDIYKELYTPIFKYVLSKTRDRNLAEDITAEVFLRFLKSISSYNQQYETPLPYLYTMARNMIINQGLKKKSLALDEDADEYISNGEKSQLEEVMQKEEIKKVLDTLHQLPDDQAEVIRLRFLSELDTREIANLLDKTEANIRKIESRALAKLRSLLNKVNG